MKLFLAGVAPWRDGGGYDPIIKEHRPYILESFYYVDADTERLLPLFGDFLLDSGAFTFMTTQKNAAIDWNGYVDEYAEFIKRNKVEKFFELDIDAVVGYETVKQLRKRLENKTGRPCIPVWHRSRGKDEFVRMCDEYRYVAIGGYVAGLKENRAETRRYEAAFPWFIRTAHEHGAKIHGLGYTNMQGLKKYHFDSVDSTAWTTGNRYGFLWKFNGQKMIKIDTPQGHRIGLSREAALINYSEWIKFQKWAETHL